MEHLPPLYVPPFDLVEDTTDPAPGTTVRVACDKNLTIEREGDLRALTDALAESVLEPETPYWENEHLVGTLRPGLTYEDFRIWVIRWWRRHVEGMDPDFFVPPFTVGSVGEFDEPDGTWVAFDPETLELRRTEVARMLASLSVAERQRPSGAVVALATGIEWVSPTRAEVAGRSSEQVIRDWLTTWWYDHVARSGR